MTKDTRATPIEVKRQRGTGHTTRERLKSEVEYLPVPEHAVPMPPEHLSQDGQELWRRLTVQMASVGILFPSCYEYLEAYCKAIENKEIALKELNEYGMFMDDEKVGRKINPAYKAYNDAVTQMIALGAKLGLSPVDKTKVNTNLIGKNTDKNSQKSISVR
jgi:P27 family predicted phage terminase small subunit